jgi:hypothetical protein
MALQGFRRLLAALACIIVGAASFALSFVALRDVAVELQAVPSSLGWLVPIVIDGGVICGSAIIWSLSREQLRRPVFPFLFVATLVLVSVVVNAAHAGPSPLAKLIAALPPLILLGTLELVASQGRRLGTTQPVVASTTKVSVPVSRDAVSEDSDRAANTPVSPLTAPRGLSTFTESVDELEAVSDLEAAVDEVFEPSTWVDPQSVMVRAEDGYTRPANRRRPTRVRAEQPLN